ncbi:Transcriptional regulator/sugar kinase [metagenome]|uniref:Transcriptional regulator/sugar kinase n=1 Tax=metagenome TaxID=256318 RepID=A0A2P2C3Z3_9ZZZZ
MAGDTRASRRVDGPGGHYDGLVAVLDQVRELGSLTRPALAHRAGLGRAVVAQRVTQLMEAGLLEDGAVAASTGGRAAREVRFNSSRGRILVAEVGASSVAVGISDLAGNILLESREPMQVADGPRTCLARIEELFDGLLVRHPDATATTWGVGLGLPGPVEFATGVPMSPPIMPGWDGYPVRQRLAERFGVPVWVDNEVNVMALGELRAGLARGEQNVVYVKAGTGIGAGLISNGALHRGEQGCAGDIGHIAVGGNRAVLCRCGKYDCLEALAGGAALARDGLQAAITRPGTHLGERLAQAGEITANDVAVGADAGDPVSRELLVRAGGLIGESLASLVNFFNPSLILLGGRVAESGDLFLAAVREATYRRSLPLATRDLRITPSTLGGLTGLTGAAFMVADELFSRPLLEAWIEEGDPSRIVREMHEEATPGSPERVLSA